MVARTRFTKADTPDPAAGGSQPRGKHDELSWAAVMQALGAVGKRLPEMREDLSCYVAVQADRARLAVSQTTSRVMSSILQVVAFAVIFATAAWLLIIGVAGGVAAALDGNVWLANLITGAAALIALWSVIAIVLGSRRRRRWRDLKLRYRSHEARDREMHETADQGATRHAQPG
jgi:hypothetical protein